MRPSALPDATRHDATTGLGTALLDRSPADLATSATATDTESGVGEAGGWGPPHGAPPWAAPTPPYGAPGRRARRAMVAALAAALVVAAGLAGFAFGLGSSGTTTGSLSSASGPTSSTVAGVDKWVVDVDTVLGYDDAQGAGTGIVLSSTGEVLTNNHVVEGATQISVTDVDNGRTYGATVVGYDPSADVAVLQLEDASGLSTARLGDSAKLAVGEAVTAIGNAGGVGGTPSESSGAVTALDQQITASDSATGTSESLSGLVETSATLEPGDSGGPLVDSSGQVVAMDTAASSGFQFQSGSSANYAIPIDTALAVAAQIEQARATSAVHVGPTAFLGVGLSSNDGAGALVQDVITSSPAADVGLEAGDVIDSLDGQSVSSPADVTAILIGLHPGASVEIGWVDPFGSPHTATVSLGTGPAA